MEAHWTGECNRLMVMLRELNHGTSYLGLREAAQVLSDTFLIVPNVVFTSAVYKNVVKS